MTAYGAVFFHIYKIHADFALALNSATLGIGTNVLNTNICVNNKKACAEYMDIREDAQISQTCITFGTRKHECRRRRQAQKFKWSYSFSS